MKKWVFFGYRSMKNDLDYEQLSKGKIKNAKQKHQQDKESIYLEGRGSVVSNGEKIFILLDKDRAVVLCRLPGLSCCP